MTTASLPVAALAGISLYAGIFHLLIHFRSSERRRTDLYFGLTALLITAYDVFCIGLYESTSVAQGAIWQRLQLASLQTASVFFIYFVDAYTERTGSTRLRALAWIFPAVACFGLFERRGLTLSLTPHVKYIDTWLFGPVTYHELEYGPLVAVQSVGMVYVGVYAVWSAIQAREGEYVRRSRIVALAVSLFVFGAFHDDLVARGLLNSVYLVEYAWTSIVVLAGYALSNELLAGLRAKQALAESKARLLHAERLESVGKLAGGIAHDLNNMLTPVLGFAQLTRDSATPGSKMRRQLENLLSAAERAAALTQQLLAYARKQVLEVRPLNLGAVLTQLEPLLRSLLPENIALEFQLAGSVPEIEADRAQLEQVWMNLAANARDAMPQGGRLTFRVEPSHELDGVPVNGAVVTVEDTGQGMSRAVLERVFDPFFSTKARNKGTGLGLSIVQGIVEQHGGRIAASSAPGQGTRFRIFFPGSEVESQGAVDTSRSEPSALAGSESVLIVDDDPAVMQLAVEALGDQGYQVFSAGSRSELDRLLTRADLELDLLLSDVVLPDMEGVQVRGAVQERFPNVASVFMTGHADEVLAPKGVLREQVELLRKPFTAAALVRRIRSVLDRKKRQEKG